MSFEFHHYHHLGAEVMSWLSDHSRKTDLIIRNQESIMSALTDLQSAIADLATEMTANNAAIDGLLTKITTPGTADADIQAAVAQIRSLTQANKDELAKITPPAAA